MLEFRSAIVDECGEFVCWCSELSEDEIRTILKEHLEWRKECKVCYW